MKSNFKLLCTLLFITSSLVAQDNIKKMSLTEAVDFAKKKNAAFQNSKLDVYLAQKKVNEILASGLPQVNGQVQMLHNITIPTSALPDFISPAVYSNLIHYGLIAPNTPPPTIGIFPAQFGVANNLTASATASQLLFDGSFLMGVKASKEYVHLSKLTTHQSEIDLEMNVKKSYYGLLLLKVTLKTLESNLTVLKRSYYEVNETFKAGLIEKIDADRLKLQLSNLQLQYDRILDNEGIAYQNLKLQIGAAETDSIVLTDSLMNFKNVVETPILELGKGEYGRRIEYQILEQQRSLNSIDKKRWEYGYVPSLSAFAQVQRNTFSQDFSKDGKLFFQNGTWYTGSYIGATLAVPIFDGLRKNALIQQNKINDKKLENGKIQLAQAIEIDRFSAKTRYMRAQQQLKIQEENVKLATQIYDRAALKLKEGLGSSLDLTSAQNELLTAQANYLTTIYDLVIAEADLKKAIGY